MHNHPKQYNYEDRAVTHKNLRRNRPIHMHENLLEHRSGRPEFRPDIVLLIEPGP